jgi:hypothetical protein
LPERSNLVIVECVIFSRLCNPMKPKLQPAISIDAPAAK